MKYIKPSIRYFLSLTLTTIIQFIFASLANAQFATVNGHSIYFEVRGKGQPVVFLHGGGSNINDSFAYQLDKFSENHQVIAIEQAGQGHSPDVPGPLSYTNMMNDTAALLKQQGIREYDLVGWSDGAIVALMLAVHHPELVRRAVVTGANISPNGLTEESIHAIRDDGSDEVFIEPERDELDTSVNPDPSHTPAFAEKLRTLWLTSPTQEQLAPALLHQVKSKVLVMAGDHDEVRLEHSILIYRSLPQAQLWIVPGTGHATLSQRPDWFNSVALLFLDQQ